jgi:anti-sigma regulatory factor (Ser/Thr protein kinase)
MIPPEDLMRPPEMQTARLPEPLARGVGGEVIPFTGLSARAPFPRFAGGRGGDGHPRFGPRIELDLDVGPAAAAEARAAVAALDGRANADVLDDVRLLLSEIVTNAVRHSDSPSGATIGLAVSVARDVVRAEVTDRGDGFDPRPRDLPRTEAGGWGLHLVDRLASRWGVDRGDAVRVWFEIDA